MSNYFSFFKVVPYDIEKNGNEENATNITLRFKLREILTNKSTAFYTYTIQDGDRADILADKYYNNPDLAWVILLTNKILNPWYDWPLDYDEFEAYIKKKYGTIAAAQQGIHHYEYIITPQQTLYNGDVVAERVLKVDQTTFASLTATERRSVTNYDYEMDLNNNKREIKILKSFYINDLLNEAETIFD